MHGDVHHGVGANGLEERETLGKADIVDRLVPCDSQRRIDPAQLRQCSILLPLSLVLLLLRCESRQASRQCQNKNFV